MPQNGGNPLIVLYWTCGPPNTVDSPPLWQQAKIIFFFLGQKLFCAGFIDWDHPTLPPVLFLRGLLTSKYLPVTVFLDFHFLVLSTSVQNSSLALWPSIVSKALPLRLLSPSVALIHLVPSAGTFEGSVPFLLQASGVVFNPGSTAVSLREPS